MLIEFGRGDVGSRLGGGEAEPLDATARRLTMSSTQSLTAVRHSTDTSGMSVVT